MTTADVRRALTAELVALQTAEQPRLLQSLGQITGGDAADVAERSAREMDLAQVEARIARLRTRLAALDRPRAAPAAPEMATPGALVVLDFGDGPEPYRVGEYAHGGESMITPDSPLGRALADARAGQALSYPTPRGRRSVTVVAVGCVARVP